MISVADLVARVRSTCPSLALVDHALTSPSDFAKPAGLISPVRAVAKPPDLMGIHRQVVLVTFGVWVILERRASSIVPGADGEFDAITAELRAGLCGWCPEEDGEPFAYAGGELAPFDRGPAVWREDFSIETELRFPT